MAAEFDLSLTNNFELELGSSLKRRRNTSCKLKLLTTKNVELKLNHQVNVSCKNNGVDLSVKNILDDVQNIQSKLNNIETTVDDSYKTLSNNVEFIEDLEKIAKIFTKNKKTIFSNCK